MVLLKKKKKSSIDMRKTVEIGAIGLIQFCNFVDKDSALKTVTQCESL